MVISFPKQEKGEIREIRKIRVQKKKKGLAYEEQGILEDGDSGHRDSADGTDHHAGSNQL